MKELTEDLDLHLEGYADLLATSINDFNVSYTESMTKVSDINQDKRQYNTKIKRGYNTKINEHMEDITQRLIEKI